MLKDIITPVRLEVYCCCNKVTVAIKHKIKPTSGMLFLDPVSLARL